MSNIHEIISLDPSKTWCEVLNNTLVFKKITNILEVNLLRNAKSVLEHQTVTVAQRTYSIKVPEVFNWDETNSILTMSYCQGDNLECLLCDSSSRSFAIELLQTLLNFIIANNFFWYDFAPRNILVNFDTIYFVDFEKGIDSSIKHLKLFLRNHVFEEYSSFLLKNERIFSSDYVYSLYDKEENITIHISNLKVKRFKAIALQLGYTDTLTLSELLNIQKMIISAEEPYFTDSKIVFPRIKLVKMLEDKLKNPNVYKEYAKLIVTINKA